MEIEDIISKAKDRGFQEIIFYLNIKKAKPLFTSYECEINNEFACMLDSGAAIPVWCTGAFKLLDTFPSAVYKPNLKSLISGFGKGVQIVDIYYISEVVFCNGEDSITFENFYLPVLDRQTFGTDMIFPIIMFKETNILISQTKHCGINKMMILQCCSKHYRATYSTRYLTVNEVVNLQNIYPDIKIGAKFIGEEDEYDKILIQEQNDFDLEEITQENCIESEATIEYPTKADTSNAFIDHNKNH